MGRASLAESFDYIGNARDASMFRREFMKRFTERRDAISLIGERQAPGGDRMVVLLGNAHDNSGVMLELGTGLMIAVATGTEAPFTSLSLHGDRLCVLGDPDWRWLLDALIVAPLMLPAEVPFGYVDDNEVRAILLNQYPFPVMYGTSGDKLTGGTYRFVLQDEDRPQPISIGSDRLAHTNILWEQVDRGRLVRLGERLNNQPGGVERLWDGTVESLVFPRPDRRTPKLSPDGLPYVGWWYGESFAGEWERPYGSTPFVDDWGGKFAE